ncbi:MAG TPA: hypothetical protein VKZ96_08255 [Thermomicrobiales bacterium]|nr:hypothetical protein [Thermomicrobiales bacterium]
MKKIALIAALLLSLLIPIPATAQEVDTGRDDQVLVRVNGSDSVEAGEVIDVVVIVNGDLEIAGEVKSTTVVVDGDVSVLNGARVDGALVVVDGTLTLRDGSVTDADIFLSDSSTWIQEEGAVVTGDVRQGDFNFRLSGSGAWRLALFSFVLWLGSTVVALLVALVFAGIGGRQLWESALNLTRRLGATVLTTLAFWVGAGLIMIPLALSGIGWALIPVVIMTGIAVWYLGYIAFGTRIGALMAGRRMGDVPDRHPYLQAIGGTLLLQLVLLLAMAGLVAGLIAGNLGDGLGLLFSAPATILLFLLWLAGILGGGALVLKAVSAWSAD